MDVQKSGAHQEGGAHREGGGSEAQAKDLCLRLLTDRARSRAELEQRLADKGFRPDIAEAVLTRLAAVKLVDDAAFAQEWVQSRHNYAGKGRQALAIKLRNKGIAPETAAAALAGISADDERARAAELVRKKLRTMRVGHDRDERNRAVRRLVGMLARRGYGQSCAFDVVKTELAAADLDELVD